MFFVTYGNTITPEDTAQSEAFFCSGSYTHYVFGVTQEIKSRITACISTLAHKHYHAQTDRDRLLHTRLAKWYKLTLMVVSLPHNEGMLLEEVSLQNGFLLSPSLIALESDTTTLVFTLFGRGYHCVVPIFETEKSSTVH